MPKSWRSSKDLNSQYFQNKDLAATSCLLFEYFRVFSCYVSSYPATSQLSWAPGDPGDGAPTRRHGVALFDLLLLGEVCQKNQGFSGASMGELVQFF